MYNVSQLVIYSICKILKRGNSLLELTHYVAFLVVLILVSKLIKVEPKLDQRSVPVLTQTSVLTDQNHSHIKPVI